MNREGACTDSGSAGRLTGEALNRIGERGAAREAEIERGLSLWFCSLARHLADDALPIFRILESRGERQTFPGEIRQAAREGEPSGPDSNGNRIHVQLYVDRDEDRLLPDLLLPIPLRVDDDDV